MQTSSGVSGENSGGQKGWTSRFAFLMASVGLAVGLGNIWRFPYITGENGGAAFVLVYLLCVFVIGVPILMAEFLLGRRGKKSPPGSMRTVALQQGRSKHWQLVGGMNLLAAFIIMIAYTAVVGWVLNYLFKAIMTGFEGVGAAESLQAFSLMLDAPWAMQFWTLLALALTGGIIYAGVQNGIERAVTVLMPGLFMMMIVLIGYNYVVGGFGEAVDYLFSADFDKINGTVVLAAIGQAFFSIGVAMAGMMTYGAYLPKNVSIPRSVVFIVFVDTLVALMAGLVIFPAVFNNGLDPAGGPGLIFKTLPVAFGQMPGGHMASVLFFLLLSVAAITSMVGLVESLTHWLEEYKGYVRHKSALAILGVISVFSVIGNLSYNILAEYRLGGKDINGLLDYFANQILLPLGGLLIAVFVGWFVARQMLQNELGLKAGWVFNGWYFLIRYVVPAAVFVVLILGVTGW